MHGVAARIANMRAAAAAAEGERAKSRLRSVPGIRSGEAYPCPLFRVLFFTLAKRDFSDPC